MNARATYAIRQATMEDLPRILNLRDQAREIMRSYGNTFQWPDGYPYDEKFIHDIEQGCSYVMADQTGVIVGTFALIPGPDITYRVIYDGQWLDDEPYHVIHRIASTPESHGILDAVLDFSESIAKNIRIDTHEANIIMRKGLEKHGYQYCGIIHLLNGDERMAFQKKLNFAILNVAPDTDQGFTHEKAFDCLHPVTSHRRNPKGTRHHRH